MDYRLKTPKRYRPNRRNRRLVGSWRWLRNLLLIPLMAYGAYMIYYNQASFRDRFFSVTDGLRDNIPDIIPPTPVPVIDVSNEMIEAERAYSAGDLNQAIANYRQVILGAPNDLLAHYRLSYLLIVTSNFGDDQQKMDEALEVSQKAINADPESPDGWAIRAMAMVWARRNGEAIAYASQALDLDPNYVMAKAFIAQSYWQANRPELAKTAIEDAVNDLREAGAAAPETVALVFRTQGYILERELDREGAIAAYLRAITAAPNLTFITTELAYSYIGNGQEDQALGLLNTALDSNPRDTDVLYVLGTIYYGNGNTEDAAQNFQRCIDIDPEHTGCLAYTGQIKFYSAANLSQDQARGIYSESIPFFERAIQAGSQDPAVWWRLARAYYWIGECPQAIQIFREGYPNAVAAAYEQYEGSVESFVTGLSDCGASVQ